MRGTGYHGDDEEVENFLNVLDIPKLTEEQKHLCEGKILQKECELMLETFQNNEVPGNDGIPVEFYKRFWTLLSEPFVNCANECFENMQMSNSQKEAVIEKKGKDRTLLENWTPIFLVNVDAKLMYEVVPNRLKKVLPCIIHYYYQYTRPNRKSASSKHTLSGPQMTDSGLLMHYQPYS